MKTHLNRSLALLALMLLAACTTQAPPPTVMPSSQQPAPGASATPTPDPTVRLRDTFDGDTLNAETWAGYPQSGQLLLRNGRLEMFSTGRLPNFPYLLTKRSIIDESGPFYFELTYELLAKGANVNLALDYLPAPAPGEPALTQPFMRAKDNYTDLRLLFSTETGDRLFTGKDGYKVGAPHTVRVEYDGTSTYRLIFDGVELGTFASRRRPQKFWVGNYPLKDVTPRTDWPHLALHGVEAGYMVAPASAAPLPTPMPTPSPASPQPVASPQ